MFVFVVRACRVEPQLYCRGFWVGNGGGGKGVKFLRLDFRFALEPLVSFFKWRYLDLFVLKVRFSLFTKPFYFTSLFKSRYLDVVAEDYLVFLKRPFLLVVVVVILEF